MNFGLKSLCGVWLGLAISAGAGAQVDLSGEWDFFFTVTQASGECAGEVGDTGSEITTLTHNVGTGEVLVQWQENFQTVSANATLVDGVLSYRLVFAQGSGFVDRDVSLTVENANSMSGGERWSYGMTANDLTACVNSDSTIVASRLIDSEDAVFGNPMRGYGVETQRLMAGSEIGRRWIELYNIHRDEFFQIMLANPEIGGEAMALALDVVESLSERSDRVINVNTVEIGGGAVLDTFNAFQPAFSALLTGDADGATITQSSVDQLNAVVDLVLPLASPELSSVIQDESDAMNDFQDLVGKDVAEFSEVVGLDVEAVGVEAYDLVANGELFQVTVAVIEGMEYSLWKSDSLDSDSWTQVAGAVFEFVGDQVTITDPSPGASRCFYQVRRVLSQGTSSQ